MEKEPWQEDIYDIEESRSERRSRGCLLYTSDAADE